MPQHRLLNALLASLTGALGASGRRDILSVALAATTAFLLYLPPGPDDSLAVMTPWVDPASSAGDVLDAGNGPVVREAFLERLRRLQFRDVLDALAEPGQVVGDVISLMIPGGSTAYRLQLSAAFFGAVTVALLVAIMRRLDVACTAAIASGLGFAFHQQTWLHAVIPDPRMGSMPVLALSVLVLLLWSETRKAGLLWIGLGCWLLSLAANPSLLCTAPVLVWFVCKAPLRESSGTLLAATVTGKALRVGVFLAVTAAGVVVTGEFNALRVYDVLSSEFGLLGFLVLSLGLAHYLWLRPTPQTLLLSLSLAGVVGGLSVSAATGAQQLPVALLFACPIVGHGLSVIVRSRTDRTHAATATAVFLVFPTINLISHRDPIEEARDDHARSVRHARALAALLPDGGAVATFPSTRKPLPRLWPLSESGRLQIVDLPWDIRRIGDIAANQPTFALDPTRTRLEYLGFRFDEPHPVRTATSLDAYLERLAPGTIVAMVAHADMVARAQAQLQSTIRFIGGGQQQPIGRDHFYGLVGLARGAAIAEESDPAGVDLRLEAGEVLDDNGRLLPATLQVESLQGRVRINVNGRPVLTDPAGVGIVVLRAGGAVERVAVAFDHADALWIPVEARPFHVARLLEWKPCMSVGQEGWLDVSSLLTGNRGAGVFFASRSAATSLALYVWKEDRRLVLRRAASLPPRTNLDFETFDRTVSAETAALDRLLEFDGLASVYSIQRQRFVQLLHVNAPEDESLLTPILFNGDVLSGMARVLGPAGAQRVTICGAG